MSSANYIDISPVISEKIGVFPGDVPYQREISLDFKKGDHLLLSAVRTSLHLGAHADGPNHYSENGKGIGERDLSIYAGPCVVLHAGSVRRGERVAISHLGQKWQEALRSGKPFPAERVLFHTGSFPNPDEWNSDFCSLDPKLIEALAQAKVRLIGIDTPSIDPETSKTLDAHQVVARYDMAILEGLVLTEAKEGLYTLIALPLRLANADASPVRAVLFRDESLFAAFNLASK